MALIPYALRERRQDASHVQVSSGGDQGSGRECASGYTDVLDVCAVDKETVVTIAVG